MRNRGLQHRMAFLAALLVCAAARADCNSAIAAITSGYGADGPYAPQERTLPNPAFRRKDVVVFLPSGAEGPRPVIFFSHGFGPNYVEAYHDLIHHWVSRGLIVVYSTYPALRATHVERYDALWAGFAAAAKAYGPEMDLSRVGFVGHSYGGGATPAMAWRGLVQQGWGRRGGFIAELAPWYTLQLTPDQQAQIPRAVLQLTESYDADDRVDPRMAIDLYQHADDGHRYYFLVRSSRSDGCTITADHSTPGRSPLLRLKQYAVFRPLDAIADLAFGGSAAARDALSSMGTERSASAFEPLERLAQPQPLRESADYKWPWDDELNPRR
jgi:pimeloyl-ACP methyl ester carboxylesterase